MAKNVIILGAGASMEFGAPVMSNFLDVAKDLFATKQTGEHSASFARVFHAISALQVVHSKAEFDLVNLESIFTAFEMAKTLNRLPGAEGVNIDQLIDDLKWVIVVTLEKSIDFQHTQGVVRPHNIVERFVGEIVRSWNLHGPGSTAILTFNYDLIIDLAVWSISQRMACEIDYGLTDKAGKMNILPVLKLHGSLNWLHQNDEPYVVPWKLEEYIKRGRAKQFLEGPAYLNVGTKIARFAENRGSVNARPVPFIVPPSWNKSEAHRAIGKVWERAASELAEAQSIFVIGYSLPQTDTFFRHLYALGSVGEPLLRRFWVFDPDPSREEVFRTMLGPGARTRYKFHKVGFGDAIDTIREALWSKS